jgi:hypothetical protein
LSEHIAGGNEYYGQTKQDDSRHNCPHYMNRKKEKLLDEGIGDTIV